MYEAAIENYFQGRALNGNYPDSAWEAITGKPAIHTYQQDATKETRKSKGSLDGTISVAGSKKIDYNDNDNKTPVYSPKITGTEYIQTKYGEKAIKQQMEIVPGHAYEVVDVRQDMICLRNPWGIGNGKDSDLSDPYKGAFWISKKDFDRLFNQVSH